jgi:rhamnose utilization protein RhaD (predicted bifunctional aldolase and dehydrogenase)
MITITQFDQAIQAIVDHIGATDFVRAANDEHVTRRLADKSGDIVVASLPTFSQRGMSENPSEQHAAFLWILSKPGADDTEQDERDNYERMQQLILQAKEFIREQQEDGCSIWWRLEVSSIIIEPEYNLWGGWNGWHMTLLF